MSDELSDLVFSNAKVHETVNCVQGSGPIASLSIIVLPTTTGSFILDLQFSALVEVVVVLNRLGYSGLVVGLLLVPFAIIPVGNLFRIRYSGVVVKEYRLGL